MKHPALVRALAATLAVFCLVTLIAAGGSLWKTHGDRGEAQRQQRLLRDRIDRAAELSESLEAKEKIYRNASDSLAEREEEHEKAISDYRGRLATYTATRAGLIMGRDALDQASKLLQRGKKEFDDGYAQYEQGAALFEEVYRAYTASEDSVARGWDTYNRAMSAIEAGEGGELDDTVSTEEVLLALAATQSSLSTMESMLQSAIDQSADGSGMGEDLQQAADLLNGADLGDADPQALARRAVEQILAQADAAREAQLAAGASEAEANAAADAVTQSALGMSYAETQAWLRQNSGSSGGGSSALAALNNIDPEQAAAMLSSIGADSDLLQQALAILQEEQQAISEQEAALLADPESIGSTEALLALLKTELDSADKILVLVSPVMESAKKEMDTLAVQMEKARKAIEDGFAVIRRNLRKLDQTEAELDEQRDEMAEEKRQLERTQRLLERHRMITEGYEETEKQFRSARTILKDYEDIAAAVEAGGELLESAEAELAAMTERQEKELLRRAAIAALMMTAAVVGIVCVAGGFEKPAMDNLWFLLLLTVLIIAVGQAGSVRLGRGLWYSSLALGLTALILLPLSISKSKKT